MIASIAPSRALNLVKRFARTMWPTDLLGGGGRRLTSPRETRSATSAAVRPRSASPMDRSVPGGGGAPPTGRRALDQATTLMTLCITGPWTRQMNLYVPGFFATNVEVPGGTRSPELRNLVRIASARDFVGASALALNTASNFVGSEQSAGDWGRLSGPGVSQNTQMY